MNDIEDALLRLDKLEQGELRVVIAQVARDTSGLKDGACLFHSATQLIPTILSGIEAIAQQIVARDCWYLHDLAV